MNEIELQIKALEDTLHNLIINEPICGPCEQCPYGYKYDEESQFKCKERKYMKAKEHKDWERRFEIWENKLSFARKRRDLINLLMDCLSYAYCDNCRYEDETDCECYRKYQNWALGHKTATMIIDRIMLELGVTANE